MKARGSELYDCTLLFEYGSFRMFLSTDINATFKALP